MLYWHRFQMKAT